jgi:flagellar biosynthetic protein FlhB
MADPSKTEAATPRRREDARKRGQVARSIELNTALGILGSLIVFELAGHFMYLELVKVCTQAWGNLDRQEINVAELQRFAFTFCFELVYIMAPMLLGAMILGVLANVLQIGVLFSPQAVVFKLENLNPVQGFGRIFSRRSVVEFFKGLLKIAIVGWVAWWTISSRVETLMAVMNSDMALFFTAVSSLTAALILRVGLALLILGILDFWYQRYEYGEKLKMSKQEVKDEFRQMEGDPQIKARVRRLQQDASRRRMLAELPTADVVITNPTHLAVAIRYDENSMEKPQVIAKGARLLAERIKEIAREHRIPVIENKPLARALFENVPVGASVPSAFFNAIAELLAYVYSMQGKLEEKAMRQRERIRKKGGLVLSPDAGHNL